MKLLIGADIVPTKSNCKLFEDGDVKTLLGDDLLAIMQKADFRVFNLETPLCDKAEPIAKCGPNLMAARSTVVGLKMMDIDLLTLANNHILDQGEQGLTSTVEVLQEQKIGFVGVGDKETAAKSYYLNDEIGVYACAEHEFSIVGKPWEQGVNPFTPRSVLDVMDAKKRCKFLVVLYHGGKEHYRYPSPDLQENLRILVDAGADLVIAQHTHCIGCEEKYHGGTIIYGQGNFLFDHSDSEFWQTSLLIKVDDDFEVSYLPLRKSSNKVRLAQGEDAEEILNIFRQRSEQIKQDAFVAQEYRKFAASMIGGYLGAFAGWTSWLPVRALNKLSGHTLTPFLVNMMYGKRLKLAMLNYVECEAHRELMIEGLNGE